MHVWTNHFTIRRYFICHQKGSSIEVNHLPAQVDKIQIPFLYLYRYCKCISNQWETPFISLPRRMKIPSASVGISSSHSLFLSSLPFFLQGNIFTGCKKLHLHIDFSFFYVHKITAQACKICFWRWNDLSVISAGLISVSL